MSKSHELSNFIWSIADLLRGPYRPPQYERVMLPLVVLRRFDCVLEGTKKAVLAKYAQYQGKQEGDALDSLLNKVSGQRFHNHSPLSFEKLKGDPDNAHLHLVSYINGFSENVRKIFERFDFGNEIERMREHNILFLVIKKFCEVDLHPNAVDNIEMGLLFEDLIRRFNEQANETAGDHFTPREVIRLMVHLLFMHDDDLLTKAGTVRKMLDPTNRKEPRRPGKIQLIDGRERWQPLRRSLGDKRREISDAHIADIVREYGDMRDNDTSKVFDNADFGYNRLAIERPLRLAFQITLERKERFLDACPELLDDLQAIDKSLGRELSCDWNAIWKQVQAVLKSRDSKWRAPQIKAFRDAFSEIDPQAKAVVAKRTGGKIEYEPDPKLRDFENVPLKEDVQTYFEREVKPHVPDAWIDHEKTKVGYEISFNRHFYRYAAPRPLAEIDADLKRAEEEIVRLLREVTAEMPA